MAILAELDLERRALRALAPAGYCIALHIRFAAPLITFQTYDRAWVDHYTVRGHVLHDPVAHWGFERTGVVRWSALADRDPAGVFAEAAQFGLRFGIAVSCGTPELRSIAGFARGDREFDDAEMAAIRATVQRLHAHAGPSDGLTPGQAAALRCIAAGERHAAAAQLLGISDSAFKARIAAARNKLRARTTAEAIQRARDYRLI